MKETIQLLLNIRLSADFLTLFIHAFGLALLRRVKCNRHFTSIQRFYLVQLSLAEMAFAMVSILIYLFANVFPNADVLRILYAIKVLPVFLPYIGTMLLITVDRLLAVYYNLRYNLMWTLRRAHVAGAILGTTSILSFVLYFVLGGDMYEQICALFVYPTADVLFITVATVTYAYFFKKIKEQRRDVRRKSIYLEASVSASVSTPRKEYAQHIEEKGEQHSQPQQQHQQNTRNNQHHQHHHRNRLRGLKRLKKNFYTPTLLVVSFMIFTIFPDIMYFCYKIGDKRMGSTLGLGFSIFYRIGLAWDAFVYIFFQQEVRNVIKSMFVKRSSSSFSSDHNSSKTPVGKLLVFVTKYFHR